MRALLLVILAGGCDGSAGPSSALPPGTMTDMETGGTGGQVSRGGEGGDGGATADRPPPGGAVFADAATDQGIAGGHTPDAATGGVLVPEDMGHGGGQIAPTDGGPTADMSRVGPMQNDAPLRINEFMASNHLTATDDVGGTPDWIELYNPTSDAVDLAGYLVTNDVTFEEVYHLQDGAVIPAHGHLVLWADSDADIGPTHLPFTLEKNGGFIGLARPAGTPIDRITYFTQTADISSGRRPDGSNFWDLIWLASPGTANPEGRGTPSANEDPARPPEQAPNASNIANRLFDNLPEFHIEISPAGIESLRAMPQNYVEAFLTFEGRRYGPVGARLKGQNSFLPIDRKPSLKLKIDAFDSGARFFGLDMVTLQNMSGDQTMVHEVIGYYVARTAGLVASRAGHALVYINEEFYGVYTNLEAIDRTFLGNWFANNDGSLYEGWDVDFRPDHIPQYQHEAGEDDRSVLLSLAQALTMPGPEAIAAAEQFIDIGQFQLYWAVCANIGQFDSFPYRNPGDDYHADIDPESMKATIIPWGMDETFFSPERNVRGVTSVLAQRCLQDPNCENGWILQLWDIQHLLQDLDLAGELDRRLDVIRPHVPLDRHKPYTDAQVTTAQRAMRDFIVNRARQLSLSVPEPQ